MSAVSARWVFCFAERWSLLRPLGRNSAAPILEQIAKTYGIDSWDKVEAIRYTWNGEITGLFELRTSGSGEA